MSVQAFGGNSFNNVEDGAVVGSEIRLYVDVDDTGTLAEGGSFVSFALSPLPTILRNCPILKKLSIFHFVYIAEGATHNQQPDKPKKKIDR